jgi:integrase
MASLFKRGPVWWVGYRLNGKKINKSLETRDERKAQRELAALELRLEKGEEKAPEQAVTLDAFMEKFREHYIHEGGSALRDSRERSWKTDVAALRSVIEFFGRQGLRRVAAVERRHVEGYRDWRLTTGVSGATVNKALRCGRAAWSWAVRMDYTRANPFSCVRPVKVPVYEPRVLSEFEVRRVLDVARDYAIFPIVATAAYSGLRMAELLSLDWSDIEFASGRDGGCIRVRCDETFHTKSRKPRMVPLAPELRTILEPLSQGRTLGLCFPSSAGTKRDGKNVGHALQAVARKAGVEFSMHDLRRTFGTLLIERGVLPTRVRDYLGHASLSTTEGYYLARMKSGGGEDVAKLSFGVQPEANPNLGTKAGTAGGPAVAAAS